MTTSPFKQIFEAKSTPVYWLETLEDVTHFGEILRESHVKKIAIDQERAPYNKFYHQIPCLLQIATEEIIGFIDLLNNPHVVDPIKDILQDPSIKKIFFDAPWDIFYYRKYLDLDIKGIKDIQVASSLLHPTLGTASLISLVNDEFHVEIMKSKKQQKSDWTKRPLKNQQIAYASHEIVWFLPVYEALIQKLKQNDLLEFFHYGNSRINLEVPNLEYSPMNIRRVKGYDSLSNQEKRRLIQLGIIRDQLAREWNRPIFHVLTNQQLLTLANKGTMLQDVLTSRQKFSKRAKNLIKKVLKDSHPDTPIENGNSHSKDILPLKQLLLNWRFSASKIHQIPKRFIISANEIEDLDDQKFNSIKMLLESIWFTKCQDPKCKTLTAELEEYLKLNSS